MTDILPTKPRAADAAVASDDDAPVRVSRLVPWVVASGMFMNQLDSTVITTSLFGMAFGGWVSGAIFDATGSYKVAFVNGILWNLLNLSIAGWLLWRSVSGRRGPRG